MSKRLEIIIDSLTGFAKIIFATIVLGHFIYPDKISLIMAILGFFITLGVIGVAWLISPGKEV